MSEAFRTADPAGDFSRMLRGEVPASPVVGLLGSRIESVDVEQGVLLASYAARADFRNPAGTVQGGMLGAMLDDLTASLCDATLGPGQAVATLSLNPSFLRPCVAGTPIRGEARLLRRGRDICHLQGTLLQNGKEVATAVAVCKIVAVG